MKKSFTNLGLKMWKARADLIYQMDMFINWEDYDVDIEMWLMDGPPDGICEEYGEFQNTKTKWTETELAEYVLEDDTFTEWVECFGRRFKNIRKEYNLDSDGLFYKVNG